LAPLIGVAGVALSTSLTLTIVVLFLAWRLAVNEPGFDARGLGVVVLKSALATAAAAIPIAYLSWGGLASGALPAGVAWIAGLALAGSAVYLVGAAAIGLREPGTVLAAVVGAMRRRRSDGR
jgi:peptidoglycan biosynthesis protein MviN/MurJ (putative lipid II flippase)